MAKDERDHGLEFLLAFDGRRHFYEGGYYLKFEIKRVKATTLRPHGLRYSFTLHDPEGKRLVGFDNAHTVKPPGKHRKRPAAADHWHRTAGDKGRVYKYKDAEQLIEDFFREVRRVFAERGVPDEAVGDSDERNDE